MNGQKIRAKRIVLHLALISGGLVLGGGCASQKEGSDTASGQQPALGLFTHVEKSGAQIWAENCTRCHTPRPATQYSAQQWDVITTHMRLRCDLNGEEQRAVYRFMTGN